MNLSGCILIAMGFILLIHLTSAATFDMHSVYGQNITDFLPTSESITYHLTSSSEIAPVSETSASLNTTPFSMIKPPSSSSEALPSNYKASSEFSSISFISVDTSISRNTAVVTGSITTPFSTAFANESSSTVRGS
jgi:hypothetical protein